MPRHAAWTILRSSSTTPLRDVDRAARRRDLGPRDRALLRRIVGTEVRRRATLRALVAAFARGKPNPDVAAHLRLGLTQLFFLDAVPPHAAVSETVSATNDTIGLAKGRYVNAVLRAALRARRPDAAGDPRRDLPERPWHFDEPVFRDPVEHPYLWAEDALSMPASLLKRWGKRHGRERAFELARTYLVEPDLSLRVVRGERDELIRTLAELDVAARPGAADEILLTGSGSTEQVVRSAPFVEGRLTVQGESALRATLLLEPRPGESLLELCAAPGGKSAVLAGAGARVVATDSNPRRLARIREGCARLGVAQGVGAVACDGTAALAQTLFDGALLDPPCSNTGVLGARPGARWRYGPASQASLVLLQDRLLREAAGRVRPGGRLVYSTCSLEPEENGQRVRAFLGERPDWTLEEEREALPAAPGSTGPVDGGYAARLRRST